MHVGLRFFLLAPEAVGAYTPTTGPPGSSKIGGRLKSLAGDRRPLVFSLTLNETKCVAAILPHQAPTRNTESLTMGDDDRAALKLVCFPQKGLADAIGVSYSTFRNWSSGRTILPDEIRTALAAFMREHAKRLVAAAEDLERS